MQEKELRKIIKQRINLEHYLGTMDYDGFEMGGEQ